MSKIRMTSMVGGPSTIPLAGEIDIWINTTNSIVLRDEYGTDTVIGSSTYTVDNGLTENVAGNFQLGGQLNGNTTIDTNGNIFQINDTNTALASFQVDNTNGYTNMAASNGTNGTVQLSGDLITLNTYPVVNTTISLTCTNGTNGTISLTSDQIFLNGGLRIKNTVTPTAYTATNNDAVLLVSVSIGVATVYLPPTPEDFQTITIKDSSNNALTNNITVDGNGIDINFSGNTTYVINTDSGFATFTYSAALGLWFSR